MSKIKLIAIDLDGTTLTGWEEISPANRAAINRAVEAGVMVIPATGRPMGIIPSVLREVFDYPYIITVNGGVLTDCSTGRPLYENLMTIPQSLEIIQYLRDEGLYPDVCIEGQAYAWQVCYDHPERYISSDFFSGGYRATRVPKEDVAQFMVETGHSPQKILAFFKDAEQYNAVHRVLDARGDLSMIPYIESVIEISAAGVDKSGALAALCDHLSISPDEVMTVGDNYNDIGMLQFAGLGVAMGNATPEIQAMADRVTAPYDEDGLAQAIHAVLDTMS